MAEKIEQPDQELQSILDGILEATPDEVTFRGGKKHIGWLCKGTIRKFTHIMTSDNSDSRNAKLCATILLNNKWKLMFLYWIYWRWLYFVDIDDVDVLRVLDCAKKKIQQQPSLLVTMLSTGMMDTMMTIAHHEASQVARHGAQDSR